jgi:hypothetical protein
MAGAAAEQALRTECMPMAATRPTSQSGSMNLPRPGLTQRNRSPATVPGVSQRRVEFGALGLASDHLGARQVWRRHRHTKAHRAGDEPARRRVGDETDHHGTGPERSARQQDSSGMPDVSSDNLLVISDIAVHDSPCRSGRRRRAARSRMGAAAAAADPGLEHCQRDRLQVAGLLSRYPRLRCRLHWQHRSPQWPCFANNAANGR